MLNNTSIVGRLTADPEIKTVKSNKDGKEVAVLRLNVAVDRPGKDAGCDFIPVTMWGKTAEFVGKYWKKGDLISIVGELRQNNYTDKEGKKRSSIEVLANTVRFCGSRRNEGGGATAPATAEANDPLGDDDEDFPFA